MEITKNINLNAPVKLTDGENQVVVAYFSANISEDQFTHSISVNVINKAVIELTPENKAEYYLQYNTFKENVTTYLG